MSLMSGQSGSQEDVLRLLANPELLKQRLEQYETAKKTAEEAIALVGPADDILRLRKEAGDLHAAAELERATAVKAKGELIAKARAEAGIIVGAAQADAEIVRREAHAIRNAAQMKNSKLETAIGLTNQQTEALNSSKQDLDRLREQSKKNSDEAFAVKQKYEALLASLEQALESFKIVIKNLNSSS